MKKLIPEKKKASDKKEIVLDADKFAINYPEYYKQLREAGLPGCCFNEIMTFTVKG